ncbi:hypothetical protein BU16DRAFT_568416 [Lophium mytilinum]|uniref:Uncharacterized protein n=1 Tax=Lophium mytilinum TaxID=390894 RepID=A0A6A6Q8Y4_9PEZI|nr:hypothetical protein BU16DRAFT_568416 [Lophium mytilinum]
METVARDAEELHSDDLEDSFKVHTTGMTVLGKAPDCLPFKDDSAMSDGEPVFLRTAEHVSTRQHENLTHTRTNIRGVETLAPVDPQHAQNSHESFGTWHGNERLDATELSRLNCSLLWQSSLAADQHLTRVFYDILEDREHTISPQASLIRFLPEATSHRPGSSVKASEVLRSHYHPKPSVICACTFPNP